MTVPITFTPDYTLITSDDELKRFVAQWNELDSIIIDTEFMRTNTFYPKPGLIQVGANEQYFLIDPLTLVDTKPFADLLENTSVVKVLHASSEDLELFRTYLGVLPTPLFDTQVAASFLGYGLSIGYKKLVDTIFETDLPKGEQRSNWLQRPLTEKQLYYAVTDVTFLGEIYKQQLVQLESIGRLAWVQEECATLVANMLVDTPIEDAYQRVKNGWKLSPQELGIMQGLAEWREKEAHGRDTPRGFLLKDYQLIELAQQQPETLEELSEITDIMRSRVRRDGEEILNIITQTADQTDVLQSMQGPLPASAKVIVKELQASISKIASEYDLVPELLMNRKSLVKLIHNLLDDGAVELPRGLSSWKRALFGDELTALLQEHKEIQ